MVYVKVFQLCKGVVNIVGSMTYRWHRHESLALWPSMCGLASIDNYGRIVTTDKRTIDDAGIMN